jgi:hypothetical protein
LTEPVLFDPAVHEASIDAAWDPEHVREAIRTIVDDAENAFDDGWPTHPTDSEPDFAAYDHERSLWMGETGIRPSCNDWRLRQRTPTASRR